MTPNLLPAAQSLKPRLIELRRAIHRQPELGFEVQRTAALVARTLTELGVEVRTGVGRTGVVGYLGEGDGPVIAIRADMDALPILEANAVDYASQVPGNMHACGHDAHTAMLLGAAMLLSQRGLAGQVRLIFQPSEEAFDAEGVSGAPRMIADGALDGVDHVIALHVAPELYTGTIAVETGQVNGADDTFLGHILGRAAHGAQPHRSIDAVWLAAQVLLALYAVPARRVDPLQPAVLSLGIIRGGTASNIIPDSVYLEGTLRSVDPGVREQLLDEVRRCFEIARALGGDYDLDFQRGYPSLHNDPAVVGHIRQAAASLLGDDSLVPGKVALGVEDFSYMAAHSPGAMFRLGVRLPGTAPRYVHTPGFDIDEDALPIGAALLAESALRLLASPD
ncbi:MAG: M20 family metallopeptidase [Anaerolineales bacterium]